jgi:hypothetical protein
MKVEAGMRSIASSLVVGLALWSSAAGAAPQDKEAGTVHVNGIRNPEMHAYRAIVAGLDVFDAQHALAPGVPQLLFQARTRSGRLLDAALLEGRPAFEGKPATEALSARLSGDGNYSLALALDEQGRFQVPRSQPAWDADAELRLSRKHSDVRVWPSVRSPGLAANQRRLGDIRLECQVFVAIAKKEAPLHIVLLANAAMLGSDWCAFMKDRDRTWAVSMPAPLGAAVLREGQRSTALRVKGSRFEVPIGDTSWGNDAIVEVEFADDASTNTNTSTNQSVKASAP